MTQKRLCSKDWQLLRRLSAAGCPVNLADFDYPLRAIVAKWETTNVYQLPTGVGIALPLHIVAADPITIAEFRLEAGWLESPIKWLRRSADGAYHLQARSAVLNFRAEQVLNHRTWSSGGLKRGAFWHGILLGVTGSLASDDATLEATLVIVDALGVEYPFPVKINNSPAAMEAVLTTGTEETGKVSKANASSAAPPVTGSWTRLIDEIIALGDPDDCA